MPCGCGCVHICVEGERRSSKGRHRTGHMARGGGGKEGRGDESSDLLVVDAS